MGLNTEVATLAAARANLYRLLARIYILEVDRPLLAALQAMAFPDFAANPELREGYVLLQDFLARATEADLEDLAADYAGIFLAAGVAQGLAAFPYESVYVSKTRMVGQGSRVRVAALYAARGLALACDLPKTPEDHVALELEYMACLCRELAETAANAEALLKEQKVFLTTHLMNWIPLFCRDMGKYAQTDFYRAIGKITAGFLQLEQALLQTEPQEV